MRFTMVCTVDTKRIGQDGELIPLLAVWFDLLCSLRNLFNPNHLGLHHNAYPIFRYLFLWKLSDCLAVASSEHSCNTATALLRQVLFVECRTNRWLNYELILR
jgi:hypothetical protein